MSCTRQLDAKELFNRPEDVTRSTVQKSVVVVARSPHLFAAWREKLSLVTRAWFMQKYVFLGFFEHCHIVPTHVWFKTRLGEAVKGTMERQAQK